MNQVTPTHEVKGISVKVLRVISGSNDLVYFERTVQDFQITNLVRVSEYFSSLFTEYSKNMRVDIKEENPMKALFLIDYMCEDKDVSDLPWDIHFVSLSVKWDVPDFVMYYTAKMKATINEIFNVACMIKLEFGSCDLALCNGLYFADKEKETYSHISQRCSIRRVSNVHHFGTSKWELLIGHYPYTNNKLLICATNSLLECSDATILSEQSATDRTFKFHSDLAITVNTLNDAEVDTFIDIVHIVKLNEVYRYKNCILDVANLVETVRNFKSLQVPKVLNACFSKEELVRILSQTIK